MGELHKAFVILTNVFRQYSSKEGDSKNLSKGELKELLQKEFQLSIGETTDKLPIDDFFNLLDQDQSGSVDFKEYVTFVINLAIILGDH